MSDLDVFRDEYLPNAQGATVSFATWKKSYPAEYTAWVAYRDAVLAGNLPQPPTMVSKYGKALAAAGQMAERDDMKVTLSTSGGTTNLEGTVTVTASPVPASQVTKVEIYVDDVLKTTDTSSPYTYSWDTTLVAAGAHQLKARAFYPRNKVAEGKLNVGVLGETDPPPPPPPPPPQAAPVNTTAPVITGTATEGQTLNVSIGVWTNSPTSYTRQWSRCDAAGANCVDISGATGTNYVLVAADVGKTIRCWTIAYNSVGPSAAVETAQSAVVGALAPAVPVLVTAPVISGTPTQGNTLTVSNGAWTNSPTSYTRQWKRCNSAGASCVSITGATATSYVLVTADVGSTLRCDVTAVNASGNSTPASTAVTAVVIAPPPPPPPPGLPNVLKWRGDFETGNTSQWSDGFLSELGGAYSIETSPALDNYSAEISLGPTSSQGRAEMSSSSLSGAAVTPPAEVLYKFAFWVPTACTFATGGDGKNNHFIQWKTDLPCYDGGLNVDTTTNPDSWEAYFRGGAITDSGGGCVFQYQRVFNLGAVVFDQWTHFQMHVYWSANPAVGYVRIWKNDIEIVPKTFLATLGATATRMKLRQGIYRRAHTGTTVAYCDGVKVYIP